MSQLELVTPDEQFAIDNGQAALSLIGRTIQGTSVENTAFTGRVVGVDPKPWKLNRWLYLVVRDTLLNTFYVKYDGEYKILD